MHLHVPNLTRADSSYRFRIAVPADLRHVFGVREIKRTLRPPNEPAALSFARSRTRDAKRLFETARDLMAKYDDEAAVGAFIRKIVSVRFRMEMDWDEELRRDSGELTEDELEFRVAVADGVVRQRKTELALNRVSDLPRKLKTFVETRFPEDSEFVRSSEVLESLCREVMKARVTAAEIVAQRARGNYDNPFDDFSNALISEVFGQSGKEPDPPAAREQTVRELADLYVRENRGAGKWTEKTERTVAAAFEMLFEWWGDDRPAARISRQDLVEFRDEVLAKLPANRKKIARYRDLAIRDILALGKVKPMSADSVRKYMTWICAFFKWAARQEAIPRNPAEGLVPSKPSGSAAKERKPFATTDLDKLVKALAAERKRQPSRQERAWIPLVAMFSGMRLNEICQLRCDDIRNHDGIDCFDVNADAEDKALKSGAAERLIPVHPKLVELGFMEYVAERRRKKDKRLWPELKHRRDGYGQDFSRWFGAFCDRHVTDDPKIVFHSFRHNVANGLKQQGVPEVAIAEILGHENPSITTGRYGKPLELPPLLKALKKLDYGVDFGALMPKAGKPEGNGGG